MQKSMIQKLMSEKREMMSEPVTKDVKAALEKDSTSTKPLDATKPKHKKHKKGKHAAKKTVA